MVKVGDTFKPGEICPESGVYRVQKCECLATQNCSLSIDQYTIPLVKRKKFPPCKNCGKNTVWEFVKKA